VRKHKKEMGEKELYSFTYQEPTSTIMTLILPNYLSKVPPSNTVTLEIELATLELWEMHSNHDTNQSYDLEWNFQPHSQAQEGKEARG
jgi:hypothetical protein